MPPCPRQRGAAPFDRLRAGSLHSPPGVHQKGLLRQGLCQDGGNKARYGRCPRAPGKGALPPSTGSGQALCTPHGAEERIGKATATEVVHAHRLRRAREDGRAHGPQTAQRRAYAHRPRPRPCRDGAAAGARRGLGGLAPARGGSIGRCARVAARTTRGRGGRAWRRRPGARAGRGRGVRRCVDQLAVGRPAHRRVHRGCGCAYARRAGQRRASRRGGGDARGSWWAATRRSSSA